ncbi:MAG: hypothetical protein RL154_669 [Pseudomonadota bacterium]|jgi:hypothetical protein
MLKKINNLSVSSLAVAIALSLNACGDSSNSSNQNSSINTITVSGVVAANIVSGSTVALYALNQNGVQGAIIGAGKTDANGNYSINVSGATVIGGGILAVATNGSYIDEVSGQNTSLTVMQAATNSLESQTLNITPMSSAAWVITQSLMAQDGLINAISIAQDEFQTFVGVGLNSTIGQSNNSNCATQNNMMLTAVSAYQYNTKASLSQAILELASEMATNLPAVNLSSTSIAPIAANYSQISTTCPTPTPTPVPICNLDATDFSKQNATGPFSFSNTSWSGQTWGPNINSYPQSVCSQSLWQQKRVLYSYENIAVTSQWNYCHHHSPNWYPGAQYSVDLTSGYSNNSATDAISLYCSSQSFYASGTSASALNFRTQSNQITNAYRWNSAYAKANISDLNTIMSAETNTSEMQTLLNKIYPTPKTGTKMVDETWYDFAYLTTTGQTANLQNNATPKTGDLYPRQAKNQAINGVDCSDLTAWAYQISLNKSFTAAVSAQAGQTDLNTSQAICENPKLQAKGAAGSFVVENSATINSTTINSNNRSALLDKLQAGDLLYIQNSGSVAHVITWIGKKVGAAGTGVTDTTVALDLIAPSDPQNSMVRKTGDWVIIDSHFQGADYRDFSGWYVTNLWCVRRVINPQNITCK